MVTSKIRCNTRARIPRMSLRRFILQLCTSSAIAVAELEARSSTDQGIGYIVGLRYIMQMNPFNVEYHKAWVA
jgi:hypothetical protein